MKIVKAAMKPLLTSFIFMLVVALLAGCAAVSKPKTLAFSDVKVVSDPAAPVAGQLAKLIVQVNNPAYAEREAEVQLQINHIQALPQLIDASREGETYVAEYVFPQAGTYQVTMHLEYEEEHYAYANPIEVGG